MSSTAGDIPASGLDPVVDAPPQTVKPTTWLGFGMMCLGLFMAVLDIQIVATSLPTIRAALKIQPDAMSWIQTAYLIAEITTIPITGFLTRALGMRRLFVLGVSMFTLASIGCASSNGIEGLIVWRVIQGCAAGTLIPAVFSAVFLLFPVRLEAPATSIAGVLAVFAPTVGPIVGGYITLTYSWHWLFLINVAPGIVAAVGGALWLPRNASKPALLRHLDYIGLVGLSVAVTALIIALKEAPGGGWASPLVLALLVVSALAGWFFTRRCLIHDNPVAAVSVLADRRVAGGCALNFISGFGFFGATYLMPVFLGLARDLNALQIGKIMLVTGIAQVITAPIAVVIEKRVDSLSLSAFGFALFGVGIAMSGFQTPTTDAAAMALPQVVRGVAMMFCLLPPTRIALGHLSLAQVPNASGLFNVSRNLGGAIGLALADTIIFGRAPQWARAIKNRLLAGDVSVAKAVGLPIDDFLAQRGQPLDQDTLDIVTPLVRKLALVRAIDEAWLVLAAITLAPVGFIVWRRLAGRRAHSLEPVRHAT